MRWTISPDWRSRKINYNILGRNALKDWTLYMDRPGVKNREKLASNPIAFLTDDGEQINRLLRDHGPQSLKNFLQKRSTQPTDEIEWRG